MPFPLDIQFVQITEAKLGRTLPYGYVARMCRNNGGAIRVKQDTFDLYPILDSTDRKRLARTCNDIVRETGQARQWRHFPPGALAVGGNGCGDQLVLLPNSVDQGFGDAVFWWDHETGELNPAADSFGELRDD